MTSALPSIRINFAAAPECGNIAMLDWPGTAVGGSAPAKIATDTVAPCAKEGVRSDGGASADGGDSVSDSASAKDSAWASDGPSSMDGSSAKDGSSAAGAISAKAGAA